MKGEGTELLRHAGVVLAAGESTRMGEPKALLRTPRDIPLALHQEDLLRRAGCEHAVVVLGCDGDRVARALPECCCVQNDRWQQGRITSVQAGLQAAMQYDGFFILPVDTVGVRLETLLTMKSAAERERPPAVRPIYQGEEGKVVWVSKRVAQTLAGWDPAREDARLDVILCPIARTVEVDDPGVLNNVNTPEEWESAKQLIG